MQVRQVWQVWARTVEMYDELLELRSREAQVEVFERGAQLGALDGAVAIRVKVLKELGHWHALRPLEQSVVQPLEHRDGEGLDRVVAQLDLEAVEPREVRDERACIRLAARRDGRRRVRAKQLRPVLGP